MAVTLYGFLNRFTEFDLNDYVTPAVNTAQNALVTAALAGAETQTDRTLFATSALADEAVMYLTAHLLARSLPAVNARLSAVDRATSPGGEDVYWKVYQRIARAATSGYRST